MNTNQPSECAFAYGDYVTATAPLDPGVKNTLVPRTERALILTPTQGSLVGPYLEHIDEQTDNGVIGQPTPVAIVELHEVNRRLRTGGQAAFLVPSDQMLT